MAAHRGPEDGAASGYGAEVIRALEAHAEPITAGNVIVAGDFNVGQGMAGILTKDWAAPVRACWEKLGLVSVYHQFFDEPFGEATQATYFHQRHAHQGLHIDYVLAHRSKVESVKHVAVGSFGEWVATRRSDHVPIFVDLDW
jgi:exodeoxyribonuclease-3